MSATVYRSLGFFAIISIVGSSSCDIGPASPHVDGPQYLRQRGYDEGLIAKVVAMEDVGEISFNKLAMEKSADVLFLITQNPNLPKRMHESLMQDSDDFVRGGAALSCHLTEEQIAAEVSKHKEPSSSNHTVLLYIARNPNVSNKILIDLHEKHGMELAWFAFNPKCPDELIQNNENDQ